MKNHDASQEWSLGPVTRMLVTGSLAPLRALRALRALAFALAVAFLLALALALGSGVAWPQREDRGRLWLVAVVASHLSISFFTALSTNKYSTNTMDFAGQVLDFPHTSEMFESTMTQYARAILGPSLRICKSSLEGSCAHLPAFRKAFTIRSQLCHHIALSR